MDKPVLAYPAGRDYSLPWLLAFSKSFTSRSGRVVGLLYTPRELLFPGSATSALHKQFISVVDCSCVLCNLYGILSFLFFRNYISSYPLSLVCRLKK